MSEPYPPRSFLNGLGHPERINHNSRWYEEGYYGSATLADILVKGASEYPNVTRAFYAHDRESRVLTLPECNSIAEDFASRFRTLGVTPGDVVAIQGPNWWEIALLSQAVIMLGATLLPIIQSCGAAELSYMLGASKAKMLIVPDRAGSTDFYARIEDLGPLPDLETILVIGEGRTPRVVGWDAFLSLNPGKLDNVGMSSDDACVLLFTSGTTSREKGVLHTHNTIIAETNTFQLYRPVDAANRLTFSAGPYGHVGSALEIVRPFMSGISTISRDRWDARACLDLITRLKPSSVAGVPFHLLTLLEALEGESADLSSLQYFGLGATSINPAQIQRLNEEGIAGLRLYGSTEHPTVSACVAGDSLEKRAHTDGRLLPGVEIRIVDEEGKDVPQGQAGELLTRGPDLFVGYLDPALNRDAFETGGWFRTGDIVTQDRDGYLAVVDRKKDIIIRGGENLSSKEIEDVLGRHPAVLETAAVGVPDERYGEKVCAFVSLKSGASLTLDAVRDHFLSSGLAKLKIPEQLHVVETLPRSPQGKVLKADLRKKLLPTGQLGDSV